jgi:uncharacterized damage-inducible protein DinB
MPIAAELVTAAQIFRRNEALLAKAIEGLTAEQWTTRLGESANSALWIVGHMVWARSRVLQLLGTPWTAPWLQQFERGATSNDSSQHPQPDEILLAWEELSTILPSALEAAHSEAMAAPAPEPSPSFDGTIGGMISFLAMHETYHVGQVVYVRRLLGHERVVG